VAWSGVGWNFAMSEKSDLKWSTTYSHSFDIGFVPGTPPPLPDGIATTKFDVAVEIKDMSTFSVQGVVDSIATASGVDTDDVVVEEITFAIKATYAFDSSVTQAQAKSTVAVANGVMESQVSLTPVSSRRLDLDSSAASLRRLAAQQYDTVIRTKDTEQATSVMTSSADVASLTAALSEVVPSAPAPTIPVAPAVEVVVKTALISETSTAVAPPSVADLNSELSSALKQTIEVEVAVATTTTTLIEGPDGLVPGDTSSALQLTPLISLPCVGLAAALAAVL